MLGEEKQDLETRVKNLEIKLTYLEKNMSDLTYKLEWYTSKIKMGEGWTKKEQ